MDCAIAGVKGWSVLLREGYARTRRAGAVAPPAASGVARRGLSTACRRSGVPQFVISDSGGAFTANAFEAVCTRLPIEPKPRESPPGASSRHWLETPLTVQRRFYD